MKNVFYYSLFKYIKPCSGKFSLENQGGAALIVLLLCSFSLHAQVGNPPITLECDEFDIVPCLLTTDQTPSNCNGCAGNAVSCKSMQYVVRLRADANVSSNDKFTLNYTDLEATFKVNVQTPNSGMTKINAERTLNACPVPTIGVDEEQQIVLINFTNTAGLPAGPAVTFSRSAAGLPFYADLFWIIVDVFPADYITLECTYFRYAQGEDVTCYYPQAIPSPNPEPNYEAPLPYTLLLQSDANMKFGFGAPNITSPTASVPVTIKSDYGFQGQTLTMDYVDFIFNVKSVLPIPKPQALNTAGFSVYIEAVSQTSPAQEYNKEYLVIARRTGGDLVLAPNELKTLFDLQVTRANPQNVSCTITLDYLDGRFSGALPIGLPFCKKLVKGEDGLKDVIFSGDGICNDPAIVMNVTGSSNSNTCSDMYVTVDIAAPAGTLAKELRFKLEFDVSAGVSLIENQISNTLPCPVYNNAPCPGMVGADCYNYDANTKTLSYCYKIDATDPNQPGLSLSGKSMVIPFTSTSGCINTVKVREAAVGLIGYGPACVPRQINVSGFYVCPKQITARATTDVTAKTCRVDGYRVNITHSTDPMDLCNLSQLVVCDDEAFSECMCGEGVFTVKPQKNDNPNDGVTTYDLVLISKHNLGIEPLGSPYKLIAADANRSNSITTFDIVELRKLIIGIYQELPSSESWRFIDAAHVFTNPLNPFADFGSVTAPNNLALGQIPVTINSSGIDRPLCEFVAMKVGDVNCNTAAICGTGDCPGCAARPQYSPDPYQIETPSQSLKAGEAVILPFVAQSQVPLIAYQCGLRFDPEKFEFAGVSAGDVAGLTSDCFNLDQVDEGQLKLIWLSPDMESETPAAGQTLFYVALRAKADIEAETMSIETDNSILQNIGYLTNGVMYPLALAARAENRRATETAKAGVSVEALPNPAGNNISFRVQTEKDTPARLLVFSSFGALMHYQELSLHTGSNPLPALDLTAWAPGIYSWKLQTDRGITSGAFVKLRQN